jgi:hypothetical protein
MGASAEAWSAALEREENDKAWHAEVDRLTAENRDLLDVIKRQNQLLATYKEALVRAITAVEDMS